MLKVIIFGEEILLIRRYFQFDFFFLVNGMAKGGVLCNTTRIH